jgi:hypothetical protein
MTENHRAIFYSHKRSESSEFARLSAFYKKYFWYKQKAAQLVNQHDRDIMSSKLSLHFDNHCRDRHYASYTLSCGKENFMPITTGIFICFNYSSASEHTLIYL